MAASSRRNTIGLAAVALLGALALAQGWLAERRPAAAEERVSGEIAVTSTADRGEGSLREAIFAADSADGRMRIVLHASPIRLRSPLPPLANPRGISIESALPEAQVDLAGVTGGPAFEIRSPHSRIVGVSLVNAPGTAVRVAASQFVLTGGRIAQCGEAVTSAEGSTGLLVEKMRLEGNGVGIRLEAAEPSITIRDNQFSGHRDAGIWAVRPPASTGDAAEPAQIHGNRFERDRLSVVAANIAVSVHDNEFVGSREFAVMLLGPGATVRANQVRDGEGIGIYAQGAPRVVIEANDVGRNRTLGVMVRDSAGATVRGNRVYGNGYGMAFVLGERASPVAVVDNSVLGQRHDGIVVIGDSPMVRGNRTLNNGAAGLRVLDVSSPAAESILAAPFLEGNTLTGNVLNDVVRGVYRIESERGTK